MVFAGFCGSRRVWLRLVRGPIVPLTPAHTRLPASSAPHQELAEESCGIAELSLSPLPNGGARNAMEETVVKPRGGGGGGGILITSTAGEKKGTGITSSGGDGGGGGEGGTGGGRRFTGPNGFVPAARAKAAVGTADVQGETGLAQPPAPQTQEPPKKRRNLDLVKPGGRAGGAAPAGGGAGGRVELFMPQYGSG